MHRSASRNASRNKYHNGHRNGSQNEAAQRISPQRNRGVMEVQIKRVYEEPSADDGYRILVDRLWPRGIRKEALAMDEWAKSLAPSTEARKAFAHKAENFPSFKGRYLQELDTSDEAAQEVEHLRQLGPAKITLLYAAKDPQVNHAVVLRSWLSERLGATEA